MSKPFKYTVSAETAAALRDDVELLTWASDLLTAVEEGAMEPRDLSLAMIERYASGSVTFEFADALMSAVGETWPAQ